MSLIETKEIGRSQDLPGMSSKVDLSEHAGSRERKKKNVSVCLIAEFWLFIKTAYTCHTDIHTWDGGQDLHYTKGLLLHVCFSFPNRPQLGRASGPALPHDPHSLLWLQTWDTLMIPSCEGHAVQVGMHARQKTFLYTHPRFSFSKKKTVVRFTGWSQPNRTHFHLV